MSDFDGLTPRRLIRRARLVPVGGMPAPEGEVDVRIADGRVVDVAPTLRPNAGEEVLVAGGRWAIPGLWDTHVHPVMWAASRGRIDLAGTQSPEDVTARVGAALVQRPGSGLVLGFGHRSGAWDRRPTVAELDVVTGERPVALVSGDGHNGWLNTAAMGLVGRTETGPLEEDEWYAAYRVLDEIAARDADPDAALVDAFDDAASRGIVGIVDFEFGNGWQSWEERFHRGLRSLRVRAATYADALDEAIGRGLRTGAPLFAGQDLLTMGPLKVISDGSLNTLTAWCCEPYADTAGPEDVHGRPNIDTDDLTELLLRARGGGLTAAVHAIGDQALKSALTAFGAAGQTGSIEHAQLVDLADLPQMARLGLVASVQPAHLLDDRDVAEQRWPGRGGRSYAFRAMQQAGVALALGSDAPVAPLDPWLAMAAAVHRSADEREPWHPEQSLTAAEALAASTDGARTIAPGAIGDIVLLESNPLDAQENSVEWGRHLGGQVVAATIRGGAVIHEAL